MQVHYNPQTLELHREYFIAPTARENFEKMDKRDDELRAQGLVPVMRTKIGRNATCPCGSGFKFKKCCIDKAR